MEVQALNRKDSIKQVARKLFRKKGYAATSMRDLAREVGIEPASLYNHIPSKEAILQEICFQMADAFFAELNKIDPFQASSEKALREAIRSHIEVIVQNLDASKVFFTEWRFLSDPELTNFKYLRRNYEAGFRRILEVGQGKGEFHFPDLKLTLFTIFSALNATYDIYNPKSGYNADQIALEIGDIIINGIKTN